MEADMQCRIVELIREKLHNKGEHRASCPDYLLIDSGNYAQYKRPYIDQILENARDVGTFPRVRPEANFSNPDGPNEQIDVIVFERELQFSISWNGGSKRYDERDVEAAFELKFIKNHNVLSNKSVVRPFVMRRNAR